MAVRPIAWPMLAAPEIILWRPLDVVGDDQVEPAILVVIKPSSAGRPSAFVGDAGLRRHVGESSIAVVVVEGGAQGAGRFVNVGGRRLHEEQVWESVLVIVDPTDARAHGFK